MTIKINKTNRLTKALLETAKDMKDAGVLGKATYEKITMRHLSYDYKGPGGIMKANEKVDHDLVNLTVFFLKAATKLTLDETIRKAQWLISNIEEEIKPGRGLANRTLKQHKKHVANLIKVQKRSIEVFGSEAAAEEWLQSEVTSAQTRREVMISDKGIEMVLDELGRIEHGTDSIHWRKAFSEYSDEELPGIALSGARIKEGLTQKKLAERLRITQGHVSEMERGKRSIDKAMAKKIATVLNVDYRIFL